MPTSTSYALRALSALLLMIGFYVLALGIAGVLIYLVFLDLTTGNRIHIRLVVGGSIAAAMILWSVIPRPDKFVPPGPRMEREGQSRLFEILDEVAEATGQAPPAEVYLIPEVNAWVAQRGGVLGFGSRPIMGLGLPLMQGLTRSQMRGVIAHEFGHYHGGDTALGPVLYRTRMAIGRTVNGLSESWLQKPFLWYGNMFLRITHATSRQQEYAADALAAGLVGSRSMIGGLEALPGLSQAFPAYWESEVIPTLNAGYMPPLADGFRRFIVNPEIASQIREVQDLSLGESAGDPYDTHPPLPDRIAALRALPERETAAEDPPAIELLNRVERLEQMMLAHMYGEEPAQELKSMTWEECGLKVYVPLYHAQVGMQTEMLQGVTPAAIPALAKNPDPLLAKLKVPEGMPPDDDTKRGFALHLVGAALILGLHRQGWEIVTVPGDPLTLKKDSITLAPQRAIHELAAGEKEPADWTKLAVEGGFAEIDLGAVVREKAEAPS